MNTLKLHTTEPRSSDVLNALMTPSREIWAYHVLRDIDAVLDRAGIPMNAERCILATELADVVERYRGSHLAEER